MSEPHDGITVASGRDPAVVRPSMLQMPNHGFQNVADSLFTAHAAIPWLERTSRCQQSSANSTHNVLNQNACAKHIEVDRLRTQREMALQTALKIGHFGVRPCRRFPWAQRVAPIQSGLVQSHSKSTSREDQLYPFLLAACSRGVFLKCSQGPLGRVPKPLDPIWQGMLRDRLASRPRAL